MRYSTQQLKQIIKEELQKEAFFGLFADSEAKQRAALEKWWEFNKSEYQSYLDKRMDKGQYFSRYADKEKANLEWVDMFNSAKRYANGAGGRIKISDDFFASWIKKKAEGTTDVRYARNQADREWEAGAEERSKKEKEDQARAEKEQDESERRAKRKEQLMFEKIENEAIYKLDKFWGAEQFYNPNGIRSFYRAHFQNKADEVDEETYIDMSQTIFLKTRYAQIVSMIKGKDIFGGFTQETQKYIDLLNKRIEAHEYTLRKNRMKNSFGYLARQMGYTPQSSS